jgi:hypothetical protein
MSEWILNDLSAPVAMLNNFSKCPYAKTAYLENKVKFYEISNTNEIHTLVANWDELLDVAVIKLPDTVTKNSISTLVDSLNDLYMPEDFVFLDDHVDNEERMGDIVFNNGKYNVLFLQRKSKLDIAAKKLEKLGYYNNWTAEYYEEVVGWRS